MLKFIQNIKVQDLIVVLIIVTSTLGYFLLSNLGEGKQEIDLFFFKVGKFGFPDTAHLIYYVKMKFFILIFALTWYFTCKYWWKNAILVIIAIEIAKLVTALNDEVSFYDEIDYIVSAPITIPIIIFIVVLSRQISRFNLSSDLRNNLDKEIDEIFSELTRDRLEDTNMLIKTYQSLKKTKSNYAPLIYLKKIITIRNQFYKF